MALRVCTALLLSLVVFSAKAKTDRTNDVDDTDAADNGTVASLPNGTVMFSASNTTATGAAQAAEMNASAAAATAREASVVANKVAARSIHITEHAQTALKRARDTIRDARADTKGLNKAQRDLLRSAESQLRDATQAAEYGKLTQAKFMNAQGHWDTHVVTDTDTTHRMKTDMEDRMEKKMEKTHETSEVEVMRKELKTLRTDLETKQRTATARHQHLSTSTSRSTTEMEQEIGTLEHMMSDLEESEKRGEVAESSVSTDEMKAEVEKIRQEVEHIEATEETEEEEQGHLKTKLKKLKNLEETRKEIGQVEADMAAKGETKEQDHDLNVLRSKEKDLEQDLGGDHGHLEVEIAETEREVGSASVDIPKKTTTLPPTGSLEYNMRRSGDDEQEEEGPNREVQQVIEEGADDNDGQRVERSSSVSSQQVDDGHGIDIDTEMPYGELEPFGREDTAQELTEASVMQSDEMVDQLERAEVAEEKRSVFRALTRLRGAAITSFDGVARAQTGNIDEYNKIHKWRKTHPLHHLADEESDITKWAFPDNADF